VNRDLLLALAGGAVGAVLAAVGFVLVRLSAVPGDVARHDRRAQALNEDLERWVADDHRALRAELGRLSGECNARGLLYSGHHLAVRSDAKTRALQRYRNRLSESERALADLDAEEGWPHALWRSVRRRPTLALHAPERIKPVIDDWRARVKVAGMEDEAAIVDPTRRTTADLLQEVRERPLDP
jgi:hypothetical protein